jgi:carbon storage regulator
MLVLSRKVGERILIGDQISVTVVRVTGGGVRIGIEAPPEMPVIREELKKSLDEPDHELSGGGANPRDRGRAGT